MEFREFREIKEFKEFKEFSEFSASDNAVAAQSSLLPFATL